MRQNDTNLALDIRKMTFDKPIVIDTYQNYAQLTGITADVLSPASSLKDGYTIISEDLYIVLYNDEILNREHLNWTLAHEIGHIYLGHTEDGSKEEVEAHWFAAELLAPEPIMRYIIGCEDIELSPQIIREMFQISKEASKKRYNTINSNNVCNFCLFEDVLNKYLNATHSYCSRSKKVMPVKSLPSRSFVIP